MSKVRIEKEDPHSKEKQAYFGYLHAEDPRDKKFTIKLRSIGEAKQRFEWQVIDYNTKEAMERGWRYWFSGPILDQGYTPQCVGYSGKKLLGSGHVRNIGAGVPTATELYKEAQRHDEWRGEDYDGTSTRGLAKVLKKRGYCEKYIWLEDVESIANFILTYGPVVAGTYWFTGMTNAMRPPERGWARVDGRVQGGHAYVIIGVNKHKKSPEGDVGAFRIVNSWGRNWGDDGRAWIKFKDVQKLLNMGNNRFSGIIEKAKHVE